MSFVFPQIDLIPMYFQVKAPWIKTFFYAEDDTYVIPGVDYVTLGGSRMFGSHKLDLDEHESKAIWDRCTRLVPSLKRAEVSAH